MFLTGVAEGGSQSRGARGQAALGVRRGGRRGGRGGGRGCGGGGASSRQGGHRGGQPLSRLHICQTQSNQQGYNSKAHPAPDTHVNTHTSTHTFLFTSHFPGTIFLFIHAHWLPAPIDLYELKKGAIFKHRTAAE